MPTHNDETPLNIPSFLLHPLPNDRREPNEEEVDAVMESVRKAAGIEPEIEPEAQITEEEQPEVEVAEEPEAEPEPELSTEPEAEREAETEPEANAELEAEAKTEEEPKPEPEQEPETEPEPEPSVEEDLQLLAQVEQRLFAHRYASTELEAFGETIDPKNATSDRAEALAVLMEEDYELLSKPEVGGMLERLTTRADELEPRQQAQVRILARDRHKLVSVPAADQAKLIRLAAESQDAWEQAKAHNDWRSFAPYLDRLVSLQRKIAKAKNPNADSYDTMLDEFEPGANRAFYNSFFARVKRCILPLLASIAKSGRTLSHACVEGNFDISRQWELAKDIARLEGINEDAHFLTSAEHPFSQSMTSNYVVTAAHVYRDDLMSNVFTMLHEIGHNLYEQGVDPALNRTSLSGGTSMGIHEAQSRFFENYVGRDRAFCGPLLDLMKQRFPGQLSRVTPNQLYAAINRVVPSLVRVDADELTYPLHIMIRYEIEQLLFDGKATAREVPRLWADRYRDYLGVEVTSDTVGALQDVHWAQGAFGYFPAYALGNAYAAQLRWKMIDEGMDWDGLLAAGDLAPIRAWLQTHVWQFGRSKDPRELIEDACGEPFNPRHYANYLTTKYTALYGIR